MPTILSPFAEELSFQYMRRADGKEITREEASKELQWYVAEKELTVEELNRILHVFDPRP